MKNLRILIVRNARFLSAPKYLPSSLRLLEWKGCPLESFSSGFYPTNIVVLILPHSHFKLEKEKPFPVRLPFFHSYSQVFIIQDNNTDKHLNQL